MAPIPLDVWGKYGRRFEKAIFCCIPLLMVVLSEPIVAASAQLSSEALKVSRLQIKAKQGSVREEAELAAAYLTGNGVAKDLSQAARWYEKAAEGGDPRAQTQIGYFYQAGIGVPVDLVQSAHWYQLSAAAGNPRGMENLGVAYLKGIGIEKNPEMARRLLTEAFHKGCGSCASYLGQMLYFGLGVPMNKATAEDWYKSGARMHVKMFRRCL